MIQAQVFQRAGVEPGAALPRYTSVGSYPLFCLAADSEPVCIDCANGPDFRDPDRDETDREFLLIDIDVYWEGPFMECAHCGEEIESAYGDPESEAEACTA